MHPRFLLLVMVVVWGWFATPAPVHACMCVAQSTEQQFRQAAAVFWGEVVDHQRGVIPTKWGSGSDLAQFRVRQAFKGVTTPEVEIETNWGSDCIPAPFELGEEYVVFASSTERGGLRAALFACGSTAFGPPDRSDPFWATIGIRPREQVPSDWIVFPATLILLVIMQLRFIQRRPPLRDSARSLTLEGEQHASES
jgi:hypothetical protein